MGLVRQSDVMNALNVLLFFLMRRSDLELFAQACVHSTLRCVVLFCHSCVPTAWFYTEMRIQDCGFRFFLIGGEISVELRRHYFTGTNVI